MNGRPTAGHGEQIRSLRLTTVATAAAALVALLARWGPDWPAQEFRALIARSQPLGLWVNNWFSGQPLAGYSLTYPALAGVLGASAVGIGSVTVAAWSAGRLLPRRLRRSHLAVEAAVVVSLVSCLLQGQLPYLLGTAFGLGALACDRARRPAAVAMCAALCSLSSPLAAMFLLLVAAATTSVRAARALGPYAAAGVGFAVALVLGGAGGPEPYPWTSLAAVGAFAVGVHVVFRGPSAGDRILRRLAICYLVLALALAPFANPVGGNVARLGWQLALPLALLAFVGRGDAAAARAGARTPAHPVAAALAAVLAVAWTVTPVAVSVAHGAKDPSQQQAYFAPLVHYLRRQEGRTTHRLEIPMTRGHWESRWVAATVPLARGWERQTDLQYNAELYHRLSGVAYRRWLDANAVGWVATPDVPLDPGGLAEGRLLEHPPPWLHEVWHNAHWRVWRVRGAVPIVSPPARLARLTTSSIVVRFSRAGTSTVRVHADAFWRIATGHGCLTSASPWLRLTAHRPGRFVLSPGLPGPGDTDQCPSRPAS